MSASAVPAPSSVADALAMARAAAAAMLDGAACGEVLVALGEIQGRLTAAHAEFLRRFDAASGHDADGYGTSSAWLAAQTRIARKDARAAVRDMRRPRRPAAAAGCSCRRGDLLLLSHCHPGLDEGPAGGAVARDRQDPAGRGRGRRR